MTALQPTSSHSRSAIDWTAALIQHRRWLTSVLRSRINDPHVVEDLYQDLSLAVLRQPSRPEDEAKVAPWLYRLAVRQAINHHRRNGRRKRLQERIEQNAYTADHEPDALDWLVQNEQRELVSCAIQSLRPQDREILTLKYTERWSYRQMAEHLGASTGTIEYRLLRAKKRLRKLLCESIPHTVNS